MSVKSVVSAIAIVAITAAVLPQPAAAQAQAQPQAPAQTQAPSQASKTANGKPINQRNYEEVYANYLASARQLQVTPGAWMADLATDPSARRTGDLVTIRVVEQLSATGSADSTINKASSADVKLPLPQSWMDMTLGRVLPFSA